MESGLDIDAFFYQVRMILLYKFIIVQKCKTHNEISQ